MTHLEQLKAKIQELVPEIMELKFGCLSENERGHRLIFLEDGWHFLENGHPSLSGNKILGRPITLADVLRAAGANIERILKIINPNTRFWRNGVLIQWDLSKTFDDQKPETHEFLYSLFFKP